VILDKDKMAENGIDPMGISQMIQANNSSSPSASFVNQDEEYLITTGKFLTSADDVENLVVGLNKNRPVYLRQVASVQDGPSTAKSYVSFGYGKK
jgi:multidrug efflux pump subunit AcrB